MAFMATTNNSNTSMTRISELSAITSLGAQDYFGINDGDNKKMTDLNLTTSLWGVAGAYAKSISLSPAQIKALNSSPFELIAAPGANKIIVPFEIWIVTLPGTAYITNVDLVLKYSSNGSAFTTPDNSIATSGATVRKIYWTGFTYMNDNDAIVLTELTGDPASGTKNISIQILYSIFDLS